MRSIANFEQGSAAWLEWRSTRKMASEASVVTGRNPWQKPIELARVKRGLAENKTNFAMKRGTQYEPLARAWFEAEMGMIGDPIVLGLGDYGASLDWYSRQGDGDSAIVTIGEFKVPQSANSELWKSVCDGVIPEYYIDQMTQQWAVSGADRAYFCAYLPELGEGKVIEYQFSPARWNEIQQAWTVFWDTYMVGDLPVEEERTDQDWFYACEAYRTAKAQLDSAQLQLDTAKNELIELAGEQSTQGCGLKLTRIDKAGSISYSKVVKDLKIPAADLEKYRGEGTTSYRIDI